MLQQTSEPLKSLIYGENNNKKLQFVIEENFKRYLAKLLKEKQSKGFRIGTKLRQLS